MAADPKAFHPRKLVVKKISGLLLIANGSKLRVVHPLIDLDEYHSFYHKALAPAQYPRSFIRDIAIAPTEMLRLDGAKETSFILLLSLLKIMKPPALSNLEPDQRLMHQLLQLDGDAWNDLLLQDPHAFLLLEARLGVDVPGVVDLDGKALALLCASGQAHGMGKHDAFVSRIINAHNEFCVEKAAPDDLSLRMRHYNRMLRAVLKGRLGGTLYEEFPFYDEIRLVNEYVLARGDYRFFDKTLLEKKYATRNERRIKAIIKRKIQQSLA